MAHRVGRYSFYIRPAIYCIDIAIMLLLAKLCLIINEDFVIFSLYIVITWVYSTIKSDFYEVYRYTKPTRIVSLLLLQLSIFALLVFAFFGLFQKIDASPVDVFLYVLYVFIGIGVNKFGIFYL